MIKMKVKTIGGNKIIGWVQCHWFLLALLLYAFLVRFLYPLTGSFMFGFDHGKDSLNALEMIVLGKLKLIGPWTSIPGLYFGPAWYYFLGLCFALGRLSPAAPVWGMLGLGLVQVYLAERYFGKVAAATIAGGALWLTVTTSAWNPFPLTLISWLILIILRQTSLDKKLTLKRAFWLGVWGSLGFHFSSAYAVFYPLLILMCLSWQRQRWWQPAVLTVALVGFLLPFLPQLGFELRHNFSETHSVIDYFSSGSASEQDQFSLARVNQVLQASLGELKLATLPDLNVPSGSLGQVVPVFVKVALILISLNFCLRLIRRQLTLSFVVEPALFIVLPLLGFCFLHFNLWYLLGMMPAAVILISQMVAASARPIRIGWIVLLLLGGLTINGREFGWGDVSENSAFYRQRQQLVATIEANAGDRPYSVYTYAPDIYDFPWQYLLLRASLISGAPLPVEFSYQVDTVDYVPGKTEILSRIPSATPPPELIYYVIDGAEPNYKYYQEWLGQHPGFAEAKLVADFGTRLQLYAAPVVTTEASSSATMIE
jgi:hypothetical protein